MAHFIKISKLISLNVIKKVKFYVAVVEYHIAIIALFAGLLLCIMLLLYSAWSLLLKPLYPI